MNKKLKENEIKMLNDLVREMKQEASDKLSLEENMQISFAARIDNLDEKKEVADICKGIHTFDDLLEQMESADGKELIIETISNSELKNKSIKEQHAILAEALEAFKAELANKGYDLGELRDLVIEKDKEVTEEELDELKEMLAEYLDRFALLHGEHEIIEGFFQSIKGEVSEELLQLYESDEEKYYMALAIYILQLQGRLAAVPPETGAEGIGAGVAASVASAKVHIKGTLGKLSSEEVLDALKKIAKVVLTIMVSLAIGAAAYIAGKFIFFIATLIFGYGVIGTIAALVFTACGTIMTIDGLYEIWEDVKESCEDAKEFALAKMTLVKKWITEEAIPALKQFWKRLKEKVSCCIPGFVGMENEEEEFCEDYSAEEDVVAEA